MLDLGEGTWLAAISGGCDSMALFHMCLEHHVKFAAAHVNYHQRKEADEEEEYVRLECEKHGIPFYVLNTPFAHTGNFEAEARKHRYSFFVKLVREHGFAGILTAHHQDDLLETYLMQKKKNIIPETFGLAEESDYQGVPLVRPLLSFTRKELEEYCARNNICYYTDSSNLTDKYERNRVRHHELAVMNTEERESLLREIHEKNERYRALRTSAKEMISDRRIMLAVYRAAGSEQRLTALREMTGTKGHQPSIRHLEEIDEVLMKQNDFIIPYGENDIVQQDGAFFLFPHREGYEKQYHSLQYEETAFYAIRPEGRTTEGVSVRPEDWPITVRSFRDGDAIRMRFGTKSVHRFFIDRHIPRYQRALWPVVVNAQGEIILVPGLGCDVMHYTTNHDFYVIQCFATEVFYHDLGKHNC